MEKFIELCKGIGIPADVIADLQKEDSKTDVSEVVEKFKKTQVDLLKADKKFVDELTNNAKKETKIVAEKTFKRSLNKKFGLGLSNSELDEISVDDLNEKADQKLKEGRDADRETLDKEIIDLNNKIKQLNEDHEKALTTERNRLFAKEDRQFIMSTGLAKVEDPEFIKLVNIKPGKALKYALTMAQAEQNLDLVVKYKDDDRKEATEIVPMRDGHPVKNADGTGFLTFDDVLLGNLSDFKERSNGGSEGGDGGSGKTDKVVFKGKEQDVYLSPEMKKMIDQNNALKSGK